MIEQELGNILPFEQPLATILTMVEVDPNDPAFDDPTKFVGPQYCEEDADRLQAEKGWTCKMDGDLWRRVVASPEPKRIFELAPIKWLVEKGAVVICAGGGGIPTCYLPDGTRTLVGSESVIDKDLASELLARELGADLFVMATDADGVFADWGTPEQRLLRNVTPDELESHEFAAGSMGPKVEAAIRFARQTGKRAAIGSLDQIEQIVAGEAGTYRLAGRRLLGNGPREMQTASPKGGRLECRGAPCRIRTCDVLIRSQALYPAEVKARFAPKGLRILPLLRTAVNPAGVPTGSISNGGERGIRTLEGSFTPLLA